jgi:hypothetical protein
VFWRVPPKDRIDPTRHKFRVATFAETLDNIRAIHRLIRKYRPQAKLLLTVSPIPLAATFRDVSAISANAASKAIIRAAVDEFFRLDQPNETLYFPSYDAVTYAFNNHWGRDRRHLQPHVLLFMMTMFEHYYCSPGVSMDELNAVYQEALKLDAKDAPAVSPLKEKNAVPEERKDLKRLRKYARKMGVPDDQLKTLGGLLLKGDDLDVSALRRELKKMKMKAA